MPHTPFLGEISIVPFAQPPKGWAFCNGQLLPINQNQPLFSLLGTTFGGNGQTNFALPDFRGCVPIHTGSGHTLGEKGGAQSVTITQQTMPQHIHMLMANTADASTDAPGSQEVLAKAALDIYRAPGNLVAMDPGCVGNTGGSQPHQNMQPFLTLNFIIALQGLFPSQN